MLRLLSRLSERGLLSRRVAHTVTYYSTSTVDGLIAHTPWERFRCLEFELMSNELSRNVTVGMSYENVECSAIVPRAVWSCLRTALTD